MLRQRCNKVNDYARNVEEEMAGGYYVCTFYERHRNNQGLSWEVLHNVTQWNTYCVIHNQIP